MRKRPHPPTLPTIQPIKLDQRINQLGVQRMNLRGEHTNTLSDRPDQLLIGERFLRHALTVVEHLFDYKRFHVISIRNDRNATVAERRASTAPP